MAHATARATALETTASGIHWTFVGGTQGEGNIGKRGKPRGVVGDGVVGCWGMNDFLWIDISIFFFEKKIKKNHIKIG